MRRFHVAAEDEIKNGRTADIYYWRTREILEAKGYASTKVILEVSISNLPREWKWGVLCGVEEEAHLFEGLPVNVWSMPEGTIMPPRDARGLRIPIMSIEGPYASFVHLETAIIGLICQASGIATAAARVKKAADGKPCFSFGIRRIHPGIAPMVDRAAFIGGFDGVSGILGSELIGEPPVGTMPHPLILILGDVERAVKAFDEVIDPKVPRVALVDTLYDEKVESLRAAEALGDKLYAVRLDTPGSRKGDFADIVREVRWELDIRGYRYVKIMVSGGLNEYSVKELSRAGADAFGVGTYVSNAPSIDFTTDVVEIEGKPIAKRGKLSGRKQAWRCPSCYTWLVTPWDTPETSCPSCSTPMEAMLKPVIREGKVLVKLPSPKEIREYVLKQLEHYSLD